MNERIRELAERAWQWAIDRDTKLVRRMNNAIIVKISVEQP